MFRSGAREKEVLPDCPDESSEVGSLERAQKARRGPTLRSRLQAQSPGLLARPVSIAVPVGGVRKAMNASTGSVGDRALDADVDSSTHRHRRRALEEINSDTTSWRLWRRAMKYAAFMERQLADFPSKEEVGGLLLTIQQLRGEFEAVRVTEKQREVEFVEKHRREIKGRDAAAGKERDLDRRSLAREYDAVLAVVKDKLQKKKEETAAEIHLQEVRARIEALTEYSEGGFKLEEELGRLRDREILLDLDYCVASVSDPSLSCLELPEVSGDSVDQE
ncbi:hypothetical protein HID58_013602 [Brassica napus]|uniref:Uncharacterized protein n=1 Tax=Brassica napus TaxID=3708 RepID=A0ABQ8E4C0_BRANA|nr:hypothetical protein HID58_013602 [Brassica napus]